MATQTTPLPGHLSPKPSQAAAAARISSRKRPERRPGMTSSSAAPLVSDVIRKKFADGWAEHVSLEYLTDAYCSFGNRAPRNDLGNSFSITGAGTITSNSRPLSSDRESSLSFDEWYQAWMRLLPLIEEFLPQDHEAWTIHFDTIMSKTNRSELWETWLAYDIMVRTQSTQVGLDPAEFHYEIWNSLEAQIMKRQVLAAARLELGLSNPLPPSQHIAPNHRRFGDTSGGRPSNGYDTMGSSTRARIESESFRNGAGTSESSQSRGVRCFICASEDPSHGPRECNAVTLTSGRECHIKRAPSAAANDSRRYDHSGNNYCYGWNGRTGCTSKADSCRNGKHWCTLCGNTLHNAQSCSAV